MSWLACQQRKNIPFVNWIEKLTNTMTTHQWSSGLKSALQINGAQAKTAHPTNIWFFL